MLQSLGIKTKKTEKLINRFAVTTGWILFIGYCSVPLSVLFKFIE